MMRTLLAEIFKCLMACWHGAHPRNPRSNGCTRKTLYFQNFSIRTCSIKTCYSILLPDTTSSEHNSQRVASGAHGAAQSCFNAIRRQPTPPAGGRPAGPRRSWFGPGPARRNGPGAEAPVDAASFDCGEGRLPRSALRRVSLLRFSCAC